MQQSLVEENISALSGILSAGSAQKPKDVVINSRFGQITVQPASAICFPHGMPGITGVLNFCITEMPNVKNNQFKLLQNLDNHALSFIVVPSTSDNQLLEPEDVADACMVLNINPKDLLVLFIVTAHQTPAGRRLSVNAKAPVFVDTKSKMATQYVFQSNLYEIQHFIS